MTIEDITKQLREGTPSPPELADFAVTLSGEYAYICSRLEEIFKVKPSEWLKLRDQCKSDAQADKKWESSQMGLTESIYKLKLKAIEKELSAIRSRLHIAEMESRNQF
jgi:uncharacterized protein